ncbi:gag protein [Leptospira ryugenii]|uniref:Gag protein n=1 Tax=Leptospira ryugenii TaxID=1917863 RepID=A0A2P2E5A4_9LEPT|nr:gag protein [Leptospira ryugenii]
MVNLKYAGEFLLADPETWVPNVKVVKFGGVVAVPDEEEPELDEEIRCNKSKFVILSLSLFCDG